MQFVGSGEECSIAELLVDLVQPRFIGGSPFYELRLISDAAVEQIMDRPRKLLRQLVDDDLAPRPDVVAERCTDHRESDYQHAQLEPSRLHPVGQRNKPPHSRL